MDTRAAATNLGRELTGVGRLVSLRRTDSVEVVAARQPVNGARPRAFPIASTLPRFPVMIPDDILDFYGFVFCQGGFRNLQITFEQFLTVIAAVKPSGLCVACEAPDDAAAKSRRV